MTKAGIGPKGNLPPHEGNVLGKVASWILIAALFERFAYYSMFGSLATYLTSTHWLQIDKNQATLYVTLLSSLVFIMPIFGAVITDTYLGRYKINLFSAALSLIGCGGIIGGIYAENKGLYIGSLLGFYSWSVAQMKPNMIVLGADQFNDTKPDQLKQRGHFFGAAYWASNIAAAVSMLLVNYISVMGLGAVKADSDGDSYKFQFLLGLAANALVVAILFFIGPKIYAPKPQGSALIDFFRVTGAALKKPPSIDGFVVVLSTIGLLLTVVALIPAFFMDQDSSGTKWYKYVLGILCLVLTSLLVVCGRKSDWVKYAETAYPGRFSPKIIQGCVDVYRMTPYFALSIPFWAVYNNMFTLFIYQGCQLRDSGYPSQCMMGFDGAVIVLVIPIMNKLVYPTFQKIFGGKFTLTPIRRIVIGMIVTGIAMLSAGLLEIARRNKPIAKERCTLEVIKTLSKQLSARPLDTMPCNLNTLDKDVDKMSRCGEDYTIYPEKDLSLYTIIIPFVFVGIAEVLFAVTYIDFFYSQVPGYIRAVCSSVQYLSISLGSMVGALVAAICQPFMKGDLNEAHLEYAYFIQMALNILAAILLMVVGRSFVYKPGTSGYLDDDCVEENSTDEELDRRSSDSDSSTAESAYEPISHKGEQTKANEEV